jgi:hypothetical protein
LDRQAVRHTVEAGGYQAAIGDGLERKALAIRIKIMMDKANIEALAKDVATTTLGPGSVRSVISAPIIDIEGQEALQLTIYVDSNLLLQGSQVINTMVEVHEALQRRGEERFPFVNFATEDELKRTPS